MVSALIEEDIRSGLWSSGGIEGKSTRYFTDAICLLPQ